MLLGVDVGTQGSKAGIYDHQGTLLGSGYAEHGFDNIRPGWVEMDPSQILGAVVNAIVRATRAAGPSAAAAVEAMALSGILCGPVFIDEVGRPVRPLIPFLDTRCVAEVEAIRAECPPRWVEECGNASLDTYMTPAVLHWVRNHEPEVYARIAKIVSLAPWVALQLMGGRADDAFTDPSHLSGWIIGWNAASRDFSDVQLADLDIPRSLTPRVVPSTQIIGALTDSMASRCGLPSGVRIAAGAGDVMQSNLGAGLVRPGMATDVAGTASILTVGVDRVHPAVTAVPGMLYSLATLPGQSLYWGYVKAGGLSLRWFRDDILRLPGDDGVYAACDADAEAVAPGSDGVMFLPYLSGGNPDSPNAAGCWLGMTTASNRAVLWRSMLESIAFEYADFLEVFTSNDIPVAEVRGVGGGARSRLWNVIKASATGVAWRVPSRQDGAVLANAALAGVAVGALDDLATTMAAWVQPGSAADPDPGAADAYAAVRSARRTLLGSSMREVFAALAPLREGTP